MERDHNMILLYYYIYNYIYIYTIIPRTKITKYSCHFYYYCLWYYCSLSTCGEVELVAPSSGDGLEPIPAGCFS